MSRVDFLTSNKKKIEYYSDFRNDFGKHPLTGQLARVTNVEDSVKQAIRNLILTDRGERAYENNLGSKIRTLLFEPIDSVTTIALQNMIQETITNFEPRCNLLTVNVVPNPDGNAYGVNIVFSLINTSNNVSLDLILTRVR